MKQKYAWIVFVLSLVTLIPFRLYQVVTLGQAAGKIFGVGRNDLGMIIAFVVFVLLIIIMMKLSKDSTEKIKTTKNIPMAIIAGLSGIMILVSSLVQLPSTMQSWSDNKAQLAGYSSYKGSRITRAKEAVEFLKTQVSVQNFTIARCILGIVACIGLLIFAWSFIKGENKFKRLPLLSAFPTMWALIRVIEVLLSRVSLVSTNVDLFDIISASFVLLFLFAQAKIFACLSEPKVIKQVFYYGFIGITSLLLYSIPNLYNMFTAGSLDLISIWQHSSNVVLALYIVFFLVYLEKNSDGIYEPEETLPQDENVVESETLIDDVEGPLPDKTDVDVEMIQVNNMINRIESANA